MNEYTEIMRSIETEYPDATDKELVSVFLARIHRVMSTSAYKFGFSVLKGSRNEQ